MKMILRRNFISPREHPDDCHVCNETQTNERRHRNFGWIWWTQSFIRMVH